jgi:hypothetical protein
MDLDGYAGMDPIAFKNFKDEYDTHNKYLHLLVRGPDLVVGETYRIFTRAINFNPTFDGGESIFIKRENGYNYFQDKTGHITMYSNREIGLHTGNYFIYKASDFSIPFYGGKKKCYTPFSFF